MSNKELLVPVGNKECLKSSIFNGCDAVYLGGKQFGARAYSDNFSKEELIEAIELCHLYGVKIYITANTMIYNNEIESFLDFITFLYTQGVDAIIMQDIGLITYLRKQLPDLDIHVSTQAHNYNKEGLSYYENIGVKRVVFDRESSLDEISAIPTTLEKEIFIHGALCICYSGNCLFSALNGGRSANRGMCVGSCRLPYSLEKNGKTIDNGYLLSTSDLNTINKFQQIMKSPIISLKIEGRMKSKEYVAIVTRIYRKLIDNYQNNKDYTISEEDKKKLYQVYNRTFTEGYLFNASNIIHSKTSNHQGIPIGQIISANNKEIKIKVTEDLHQGDAIRFPTINEGMYINFLYNENKQLTSTITKNNIALLINHKIKTNFQKLKNSPVLRTIDKTLVEELAKYPERKIPVTMRFIAQLSKPIQLTIQTTNEAITVYGNIPDKAINNPITKQNIHNQLSKIGDTPFQIQKLDIELTSNLFIPLKELNEIRRKGLSQLTEARKNQKRSCPKITYQKDPNQNIKYQKLAILVRTGEQLLTALQSKASFIYVTKEELYQKYKDDPRIFFRLERVQKQYKNYNNEKLLCQELGSIMKYSSNNIVHSDYSMNIANDLSITALNPYTKNCTLSVECSDTQLNEIKNKNLSQIIIYGHLEAMVIKNNIYSITNEKTYLIDKNKNKYPILYENNLTHIIHYQTIDKISNSHINKQFSTLRIELLDETKEELNKIIRRIEKEYDIM